MSQMLCRLKQRFEISIWRPLSVETSESESRLELEKTRLCTETTFVSFNDRKNKVLPSRRLHSFGAFCPFILSLFLPPGQDKFLIGHTSSICSI